MEFETLIDPKGKEHMVFNAQEINNDDIIGDSSSDFEYLQLLGEGGFGKVLKVCSLVNHKIYAMKILKLEDDERISKEEKEKYFKSEIELLKKLNHPNIVKYYKSFREDDQLYIIMEYFDNGDLSDYVKVLKYDKNLDKKPEIWNIFYQSISGLNYLHASGVVHRDIKPENIFMAKNKIIKIGDFGVSALIKEKKDAKNIRRLKGTILGTPEYMAPELFKKQKLYNEKIDIFSMGCVFYKICCLKDYQKEDVYMEGNEFKRKMISNEIPTNYDTDLMNIIKLMLEPDPDRRKDSKYILEKISDNYKKIFIQNSGLYSVIRCLSNLPYLRNYFLTKYKDSAPKLSNQGLTSSVYQNMKKPYSESFLSLIENNNNWIENLTFYRQKIIEENNFLNNNKEINPYLIFTFILDKIHGELNKVTKNTTKSLKKRTSFKDAMKEDKIKREYTSSFSANFNSSISNYFVGHMETIRTCCKCNTPSYLFTYFFSLSFDLNLPLLLKKEKKEIDLIDLFTIQNDISLDLKGLKKVQCNKCNKEIEHKESKIFYLFPFQLVLNFDRGNECENNIKINYPEKLDLSKIPKDEKYSCKIFDLVGVIKKCDIGAKEHYISLIFNSSDKCWYSFYNEKKEKIKGPQDHKDGDVLMLFYIAPKN